MDHFVKYGFKDFIVAAGFKSKIIKNFFDKKHKDRKIEVIDTGLNTLTGGRIKRLQKYLNDKNFFLTYGDGVSNVNLKKLLNFHIKKKGIATLTAVRPPARFGAIKIINNKVTVFREKSNLDVGWINGGFFILEPEIFEFLKTDKTILEEYPLKELGKRRKLFAYKHKSFWQCMDTIRDKEILERSLKILQKKK